MAKIAAAAVLLAWVCLIHSSEALPLQMSDTVSLVQAAEKPESLAQQEKSDESAVAVAEKEVELAKQGRNTQQTQLQPPTPMHGDDKEDKAVDRMVHEVTNSGGKIDHDESTRDSDGVAMHAQEGTPRDKPDRNGLLKPGQKGFLLQQVTGPVKPFAKTMADINHKLQRKWQDKRQMAYQHEEAATLARQASRAVGRMAEEVGTEAEENAQHKAAAAAECAMKLKSTSDEEEKSVIAKECKEALAAKEKAYQEAADAMSASNKAIQQAGENAGRIVGDAGLHEDGTSDLLKAEKAAAGAKLQLEMHDREAKKDEAIMKQRMKLEADTHALMQRAQIQEDAAQDAYDLKMAKAEAAPPPAAASPREPRPERLNSAEAKAMNSALNLPTTATAGKEDGTTRQLKQEKDELRGALLDIKSGKN